MIDEEETKITTETCLKYEQQALYKLPGKLTL